jgi:hypothetical protein
MTRNQIRKRIAEIEQFILVNPEQAKILGFTELLKQLRKDLEDCKR